jgi:hypothetical protein
VGRAYQDHKSISTIFQNCKNTILGLSTFLGIITLWYEYGRKDIVSFLSIAVLLLGIFGSITIEEELKIHYLFAVFAFLGILTFMGRNAYLHFDSSSLGPILFILFGIVYFLAVYMISHLILFPPNAFLSERSEGTEGEVEGEVERRREERMDIYFLYSELAFLFFFDIAYILLHFFS